MTEIRVLLVDDHTIVRKGLRSLLDGESSVVVVGEAENGREAIEKVQQWLPDVVLMDITMPVLNGLEATRQIRKMFPQVKVLVLTVHASEEYILQILRAGASGYLVKHAAVPELISAIQAVHRDESYLSPAVSRIVIDEYSRQAGIIGPIDNLDRLTDREREILQLVSEGNSNRAIAALLHISVKTVEVHRANLMDKLDIHTTAELTKFAIRKGIIRSDT